MDYTHLHHVLFSLYLELTYLSGKTSTLSVLNFPNRIKQYNQNKRFVIIMCYESIYILDITTKKAPIAE